MDPEASLFCDPWVVEQVAVCCKWGRSCPLCHNPVRYRIYEQVNVLLFFPSLYLQADVLVSQIQYRIVLVGFDFGVVCSSGIASQVEIFHIYLGMYHYEHA